MLAPDLFAVFLERLDQAGIRYVVTGSVAVIVYGDPRMTHDIDLVVELQRSQVTAFHEVFPDEEFYCPPPEVIIVECARSTRGHFNIIHHTSGFKADIYPVGNDSLLAWALNNAHVFNFGGTRICVAPPEYVIIKKLEYFREGRSHKHISDIRGMLEAMPDLMTSNKLNTLITQQGLHEIWSMVISDSSQGEHPCN